MTLELQCVGLVMVPLGVPTLWYYDPEVTCTGMQEQLPNGDDRFEILQGGPVPEDFLHISNIGREDPAFCIVCCQVDLIGSGDPACRNFPVQAVGKGPIYIIGSNLLSLPINVYV